WVFAVCAPAQYPRSSLLELPFEMRDLMLRQKTPFARFQFFIFEETDAYAPQFFDGMASRLKHAADLLIATLMQRDFEPRILTAFEGDDLARREAFVINISATAKAVQIALGRHACDFDVINLRNNPSCGHQFCELAVIGQNQQTL